MSNKFEEEATRMQATVDKAFRSAVMEGSARNCAVRKEAQGKLSQAAVLRSSPVEPEVW